MSERAPEGDHPPDAELPERVEAGTGDADAGGYGEVVAEDDRSPGWLERPGVTPYHVYDPKSGDEITDIDDAEGGILWEDKTAVNAINPLTGADETAAWLDKHIDGKVDKYLDARQHLPNYEQAEIGFSFSRPGADPAFRTAVEQRVEQIAADRGLTIHVKWS